MLSTDITGATATVLMYLSRIGLTAEASGIMSREPNLDDLSTMLQNHILCVPFENLGQHTHPSGRGCPEVPRHWSGELGTLDTAKFLKKIVYDQRGGFCWEINFCFAFLLRALRYRGECNGRRACLTYQWHAVGPKKGTNSCNRCSPNSSLTAHPGWDGAPHYLCKN